MKRKLLAAAAAFLAVGSAQAQMNLPPANRFYGELGYTFMKIDAAGTSARPGLIRGIIGYDFHPMWAVEGMLGGGVNGDRKNVSVGGLPAEVEVSNKSLYGIFVKPKYTFGAAEVFGRIGYAHTKIEVDSRSALLGDSTQSDDDVSYGIGFNYRFSRNVYAGIDWMRYSNQSGHKIDGMTISIGYNW